VQACSCSSMESVLLLLHRAVRLTQSLMSRSTDFLDRKANGPASRGGGDKNCDEVGGAHRIKAIRPSPRLVSDNRAHQRLACVNFGRNAVRSTHGGCVLPTGFLSHCTDSCGQPRRKSLRSIRTSLEQLNSIHHPIKGPTMHPFRSVTHPVIIDDTVPSDQPPGGLAVSPCWPDKL
jgi:hypothetical protein